MVEGDIEHRLGVDAVAGVAVGRLLVPKVIGDLTLESRLRDPLRQLLQQAALASRALHSVVWAYRPRVVARVLMVRGLVRKSSMPAAVHAS